ncbi:uncharacterized protein LOC122395517 isoform X2 [Colletes gigas]|uniref:uncharacterized protein LOC122395517 isoform X2 n=1 Tax=Colletes gigas TaxID=935657 RepID=UPI001C9B74E3|nr:uncharacterized protein LOC122395517 isoform X2 [Colletes gigas]
MSNTEAIKLDADQESCVSEITKPNQENSVVPETNNENATVQAADSAAAHKSENQNADTLLKGPTGTPEIVNENIPTNGTVTESECVTESAKGIVDNATMLPESKPNEQPPCAPEIQQPPSIGAGDTCPVVKPDEATDDRKSDKEIADQASTLKENSFADVDRKKATEERDCYRKKLESTEKKLAELQASYDALLKGDGDEVLHRRMMDQLKGKLIQTSLQLEDRIRTCSNQEKQISALNSQVASLKEVESLTRSLLQIRNMEVKHLQAEVDDMEVRITDERDRYTTMINKMDAAVKLNADLKKEYETQLSLFRDLREKYEEKVILLSEEKRALENSAQIVPQ